MIANHLDSIIQIFRQYPRLLHAHKQNIIVSPLTPPPRSSSPPSSISSRTSEEKRRPRHVKQLASSVPVKSYPVDITQFEDRDFRGEDYAKSRLIDATELELQHHFEKLELTREQISKDMNRTLFSNYHQFVLISREIEILQTEVRGGRSGVAEMKGLVGRMRQCEDAASNKKEDLVGLVGANGQSDKQTRKNGNEYKGSTAIGRRLSTASVQSINTRNAAIPSEDKLFQLDCLIARRDLDGVVTYIERCKFRLHDRQAWPVTN